MWHHHKTPLWPKSGETSRVCQRRIFEWKWKWKTQKMQNDKFYKMAISVFGKKWVFDPWNKKTHFLNWPHPKVSNERKRNKVYTTTSPKSVRQDSTGQVIVTKWACFHFKFMLNYYVNFSNALLETFRCRTKKKTNDTIRFLIPDLTLPDWRTGQDKHYFCQNLTRAWPGFQLNAIDRGGGSAPMLTSKPMNAARRARRRLKGIGKMVLKHS